MADEGNIASDPDMAALALRVSGRIDRPLVLVGMMGVGKSTIGRRIASLLNLDFVDSDDEIVAAAQMSISEIFETYGEAVFRDGERRVFARLIDGQPKVIAAGGGAFCHAQTRALILDKAIAVWLDTDIDVLVERVSRKQTRPLLRNADARETLIRLDAQRRDHYACAPIHVTSDGGPRGQTVYKILESIDSWL